MPRRRSLAKDAKKILKGSGKEFMKFISKLGKTPRKRERYGKNK